MGCLQQIPPALQGILLSDRHPTYANPTIIQVTCEIAFTSSDDVKLSAAKLYPSFMADFPEIQPVNAAMQLVFGSQPIVDPAISAPAGAFRFATEDGKNFIQLSKTNFVFQSNEKYPGWGDFSAKLLELWKASCPHVKPSNIVKLGLRYINRIVKTESHQKPSFWLQTSADLPAALVESKEHFLGRIESSPAPLHLRLVTVAAEAPGPDWPHGSIIMDIDRITTEQIAAEEKPIIEHLGLLHEDIWTSFDSAATQNLKNYLAGTLT
jgi:uncharacterized protein (TIGR04255 family)